MLFDPYKSCNTESAEAAGGEYKELPNNKQIQIISMSWNQYILENTQLQKTYPQFFLKGFIVYGILFIRNKSCANDVTAVKQVGLQCLNPELCDTGW